MLGILCLILSLTALWVWKKVADHDKGLVGSYAILSAILVALCMNFLFVLNVEAIHFIQYAIFAIICFQINSSYWKTMFWSVIAGVIDELYQYMWLTPNKSEYFDFNDVIIDAVGAGIGLIIIRVLAPPVQGFSAESFIKSFESIFILLIGSLILIGLMTNYISYGYDEAAMFCFIKVEHLDFWHIVHPAIKFHVVKPIEGFFISLFLIMCYSFLQKGSKDLNQYEEI